MNKAETKAVEIAMIIAFVVLIITLYIFLAKPTWVYGAEPRIDNQGSRGICVVYAVANGIEYQMQLQGIETPENGFSKAWLYNECKKIDGIDGEGTLINYALEVAYEKGLCPTDDYGSKNANEIASQYKITTYAGILTNLDSIEKLIDGGHVILVNSRVTDDWKDGIITKPDEDSKVLHATYLFSHNDDSRILTGVSSWGSKYGYNGTYQMAYECFYFPCIIGTWIFDVN